MESPKVVARSRLTRRGLSSFGGYALKNATCPANTTKCGGAGCCPTGYGCDDTYSFALTCCPGNNTDCRPTVSALKTCADNSWDLYATISPDYYCCTSNTVLAGSISEGYNCLDNTLPIPTSLLVATIRQATGTRTVGLSAAATSGASSGASAGQPDGGEGTSQGHSLSTGGIAAIAVLSALVFFLAVALIGGCIFYKIQRRKWATSGTAVHVDQHHPKAKEPPITVGRRDGLHANELPGESRPGFVQEMDASRP